MQPPQWTTGVLEQGTSDWEVRVAVNALLAQVGVHAGHDAVGAGRSEVVA